MASTFTIDEITGKVASISYLDAEGDPTSDPGATVTGWTSSNTAVATIDSFSGTLTGVGMGDTDISATVTNPDGSTVPVTADTLTITAGKPASAIVQIA